MSVRHQCDNCGDVIDGKFRCVALTDEDDKPPATGQHVWWKELCKLCSDGVERVLKVNANRPRAK